MMDGAMSLKISFFLFMLFFSFLFGQFSDTRDFVFHFLSLGSVLRNVLSQSRSHSRGLTRLGTFPFPFRISGDSYGRCVKSSLVGLQGAFFFFSYSTKKGFLSYGLYAPRRTERTTKLPMVILLLLFFYISCLSFSLMSLCFDVLCLCFYFSLVLSQYFVLWFSFLVHVLHSLWVVKLLFIE